MAANAERRDTAGQSVRHKQLWAKNWWHTQQIRMKSGADHVVGGPTLVISTLMSRTKACDPVSSRDRRMEYCSANWHPTGNRRQHDLRGGSTPNSGYAVATWATTEPEFRDHHSRSSNKELSRCRITRAMISSYRTWWPAPLLSTKHAPSVGREALCGFRKRAVIHSRHLARTVNLSGMNLQRIARRVGSRS